MKSFSKLFASLAAAGLLLAGCSSAVTTTTNTDTSNPASVLPLTFEGAVDSDWVNKSGWQNQAEFPALTTAALTNQGYRNLDFLNGSHGATGWNDTGFVGSQALKFTIKSKFKDETPNDNNADSHALLNLTNLDLSSLSSKTGIKFSLLVPKDDADFVHQVGFTVLVRQRTGTDENFAVYAANLSADREAGDATLVNTAGSGSDWIWLGDGSVFTFKVPFDYFRVPGWLTGGSDSEPGDSTSVAGALTAGAVFNSFDLDFRFNKPASSYTEDHDYIVYLDNVELY